MQKNNHIKRPVSFTACILLTLFCAGLYSCSPLKQAYSPAEKIAPEKLKADAILLRKILEANHPSLYWYTPKDSMDFYFTQTINGLTDSLNELQFRNRIAELVAKIRCGHTAVRSSRNYARYYTTHRLPQFPLAIKAWGDSLVVLNNSIKTDTVFKRGTVITAINGLGSSTLLTPMLNTISTDGYSNNFKYQIVSIYFPMFYQMIAGLKDSNLISYIDGQGKEKTAVLKNFNPVPDTSKTHPTAFAPFTKPTRKQIKAARKRNNTVLSFDSTNTAYMRLTTFSGSGLRKIFRRSFKKIKERQSGNLVIDLRENGGGNIGVSTNLTRYLIQHPFTTADTVAAISRKLAYSRYIRPAWIYKAVMVLSTKKQQDGKYHFGNLEHHVFEPKGHLHFNGNVYIVQGGFTFSAASMFVARLKGQQNVTVVGEESGGGSYGNSSVHLPTIVLPNTHVEVIMPLYRIVNDATKVKTGRGVLPDVLVPPTAKAIKDGIDIKMQTVRELIKSRR